MMDDDDCCGGGSTLVDNQQHHHHLSHSGDSAGSASSTLIQLLLLLPALRQADQLIRQYWTRVHRENQQPHVATTQAQRQHNVDTVEGLGGSGFARQSSAADRSSSVGNGAGANVVKMNKLFVEMLEACLR